MDYIVDIVERLIKCRGNGNVGNLNKSQIGRSA